MQGCLFLEGLQGLQLMEKSPSKDALTCEVVWFMEISIKSHSLHPPLFVTMCPVNVTVTF